MLFWTFSTLLSLSVSNYKSHLRGFYSFNFNCFSIFFLLYSSSFQYFFSYIFNFFLIFFIYIVFNCFSIILFFYFQLFSRANSLNNLLWLTFTVYFANLMNLPWNFCYTLLNTSYRLYINLINTLCIVVQFS